MKRNPFAQALILIVAAAVIAVVANGFAANTRRLMLPGYYPNALKVPPLNPVVAPPPARTETAPEVPPTSTIVETATTATVPTTTTPTTTVPTTTTTIAPAPVPPTDPFRKPEPVAPKPAAADPLTRFTPHPDKPYIEISGEDAAALHAKGVLFLDARRSSVFEEGHIAGARPFSVWEADVDDKVNKLFDERQDQTAQNLAIVIYCTGGACEDSHMLAQKLWGVQFNNVYVYKDGFPDWQQRGGAVRTGATP